MFQKGRETAILIDNVIICTGTWQNQLIPLAQHMPDTHTHRIHIISDQIISEITSKKALAVFCFSYCLLYILLSICPRLMSMAISCMYGLHICARGQLVQQNYPRGQLAQQNHPRGQHAQQNHPRGQFSPGLSPRGQVHDMAMSAYWVCI